MNPLALAAVPLMGVISSGVSLLAQVSEGSGTEITLAINGVSMTASAGVLYYIVRQIVSKDGSLVNRSVAQAEERNAELAHAVTHALDKSTERERLFPEYLVEIGRASCRERV